jgi:hypothetical protein
MSSKQDFLEAIADAAGVDVTDIKVRKLDFTTGSVTLEIDGIDIDPDEDEEDEDAGDLEEAEEE